MKLHDLYAQPDLWVVPLMLLAQRTPSENISHKRMPTPEEHKAFIESRPYDAWYLIEADSGAPAGCVYLTRNREVGVGVLRQYQRQGLARDAVLELMRLHPGRHLANINPANLASVALFRGLGFSGPIQHTLQREA